MKVTAKEIATGSGSGWDKGLEKARERARDGEKDWKVEPTAGVAAWGVLEAWEEGVVKEEETQASEVKEAATVGEVVEAAPEAVGMADVGAACTCACTRNELFCG